MKRMIRLSIVLGVIFALGSFSNLVAQSADKLTYLTEEYPPFNYVENGKLKGIAVELLKAIWAEMGVPEQKIGLYPWARAYKMALTKPGTVLFSTTRSPEREDLFKWVGPIKSNPIGLIARKDRNIKIGSFDDMKKYRIATIREDFSESVLVNKGFDVHQFDRSAKVILNIRKMDRGRVDIVVNNVEGTFQMIKADGLNQADYEHVWTISDIPLNYAFHKDTPQSLVDQFQETLNGLEPKRQELLKKYGQ